MIPTITKILLSKPARFAAKRAYKALRNKLNKNTVFTKKQKLIKYRDTLKKSQDTSVKNLKEALGTYKGWWKDRFKPGETTAQGRKYLKENIESTTNLIKNRSKTYMENVKTLDDKISKMKIGGMVDYYKDIL